ncbi:chloride channel protein [Rarobacter incanus]|uniref:chloride channel protein n=1 Tax=Rarobacter incanus TaxID=153494 RepID=UPI0014770810|nr:chloride channel protein [Rarobacter incanus]
MSELPSSGDLAPYPATAARIPDTPSSAKSQITDDYLITAGAAAGLSGAFGAPLSGIVFALEKLHTSFSTFVILAAAAGAFVADFLASAVFGLQPVLSFVDLGFLLLRQYAWLIPIGVVAGLTGAAMTRGYLWMSRVAGAIAMYWRIVAASFVALGVGLWAPSLVGGGENLIELAENAVAGLVPLIALLAGKMLFSMTSFASGVPGGIFMPVLAAGALSGAVCGSLLVSAGWAARDDAAVFAVAAMAATLTATVKSPLTSIVLTVEMVGTVTHVLPMALCAFVALGMGDLVRSPAIYSALLRRRLAAEGVTGAK